MYKLCTRDLIRFGDRRFGNPCRSALPRRRRNRRKRRKLYGYDMVAKTIITCDYLEGLDRGFIALDLI